MLLSVLLFSLNSYGFKWEGLELSDTVISKISDSLIMSGYKKKSNGIYWKQDSCGNYYEIGHDNYRDGGISCFIIGKSSGSKFSKFMSELKPKFISKKNRYPGIHTIFAVLSDLRTLIYCSYNEVAGSLFMSFSLSDSEMISVIRNE